MKRLLKDILNLLFAPYEVRVVWGDKRVVHYAWSLNEAMQWMECYPRGTVTIIGDMMMGNHTGNINHIDY